MIEKVRFEDAPAASATRLIEIRKIPIPGAKACSVRAHSHVSKVSSSVRGHHLVADVQLGARYLRTYQSEQTKELKFCRQQAHRLVGKQLASLIKATNNKDKINSQKRVAQWLKEHNGLSRHHQRHGPSYFRVRQRKLVSTA